MPDVREPGAVARAAADISIGTAAWSTASLGGSTQRTWRVTHGEDRAVVRLDASRAVLERLSQLGVAPAVRAAGRVHGRSYVIQEEVAAPPPTRQWLADHPDVAGRVFRTYASDPVLRALAEPLPAEAFAADLLAGARAARVGRRRLRLLEQLARDATSVESDARVASHGDPNSSNFLLAERLLLVDWDDLRLADPMRDLGPFAWWYLPEAAWPTLVRAAGQPWTDAGRSRIFWWAAMESLDVALRLRTVDRDLAEGFLTDVEAAARHEPNPRAGLARD